MLIALGAALINPGHRSSPRLNPTLPPTAPLRSPQGSVAAVMVSGVANRVLYKMAITPLSNYGGRCCSEQSAFRFTFEPLYACGPARPARQMVPPPLARVCLCAVFFMAQLQTFGYCAVYFSILLARHRCGAALIPCGQVLQQRVWVAWRLALHEAPGEHIFHA